MQNENYICWKTLMISYIVQNKIKWRKKSLQKHITPFEFDNVQKDQGKY